MGVWYKKDGKTRPEYWVWSAMKQRCRNQKNAAWLDYGGRGIDIHHEWEDFDGFIASMGLRPGPKMTLDRVDNDKGYSPENCRWRSIIEQANNRRSNRRIDIDGVIKTVSEWSRLYGVRESFIRNRLNRGWDAKSAVTSPYVVQCGERASRAKLNESDVLAIRSARGKETSRALSERYGVSNQQISSIWTRRTWKHVP